MTNEEKELLIKLVESSARVEEKVYALDKKVDDIKGNTGRRLDNLESNQTWLWRTTIGAFITGAIGLVWKVVGKG